MNRPTKGQWRGYSVLCTILVIALAILVFWPLAAPAGNGNDECMDSQFVSIKNAIAMFEGDSLDSKEVYLPEKGECRSDGNHFEYSTSKNQRKFVVELNSADTMELQLLYGIGPAFARRIVKYRALLGGYIRCEQLMEVYGMDRERYDGIAAHISVDTTLIKRIPVNAATASELSRHPYLDYYQAKAIVNYRRQVGPILNVQDLYKVTLMDSTTVTKIKGYIQFK